MVGVLRRIGIALGSLVAGFLCVGLVGGVFMGVTATVPSTTTFNVGMFVAVILGGLIYRDILSREARRGS